MGFTFVKDFFYRYRSIPYFYIISNNIRVVLTTNHSMIPLYSLFALNIISEAFRLSGFYNKIYNRYFIFYYNDKKMTFNDNKFLDSDNKPHYLSISNLLFPEIDFYRYELKEKYKNQKGGSNKNLNKEEGQFLMEIVNDFLKHYQTFKENPLKSIGFLIMLSGKTIVKITKNVVGYLIPQFIKDLFKGKEISDTIKDKNLSIINIDDNQKLLNIVKYNFDDVLEENIVNIEKLYKKMLDVEDNDDFLIVHKIRLNAFR